MGIHISSPRVRTPVKKYKKVRINTSLLRATCRRDIKKNSFPQRCVEVWEGLEKEAVQAKTISEFKTKLDDCSNTNRTART